jgi:hypothetical protein
MPQNEPMSAEAFCNLVWDGETGAGTYDECLAACNKRDAQLIRSTLEDAAERARAWYIRTAGVEGCKSLEEAILEPLKG